MFEYFFGFYHENLIIDLIFEVNYIGKLIDNVQYFLKKDLNIIKKYIILKYLITQNRIKYDEWNNTESLENEIITMEKLINEFQTKKNKDIQGKEEISQDNNDNKNYDSLYEIEFIEKEDNSEIYKGYDYYRKKASEAKNTNEFFEYSHKLFKHLKIV